ncbi:MAG: hypothetical protein ABSF18_01110 [Gammaproteobacteria bacterium]
MKILLLLILSSIYQNIFASNIAIAEQFNTHPLLVYCFDEGQWINNCHDTENTAPGHYDYLFKGLNDSIAFGFNHETATLVTACKNDEETTWYNCSPDEAYGYFSSASMNNHDEFLIIGNGAEGELLATCLSANQEWQNCSPSQNTQGFYTKGAVSFGNQQWMVLSGTRDWINGQTIIPAFCLQEKNKTWQQCDVIINDPDQSQYHSIFAFNALQYLPKENLWLAVGMGGKNLFKSICKHDNDLFWHDCTDSEFPSVGVQSLVQNAKGDLIQINVVSHFTPDDYLLSSQILCRKSNQSWQDCSYNIKNQMSDIYVGATFDELQQKWLLIGNHYENNQTTFLTATQSENDWQVQRQMMIDHEASFLTDLL